MRVCVCVCVCVCICVCVCVRVPATCGVYQLANVHHALQEWDKAKEHYVTTLSYVHAAHREKTAEYSSSERASFHDVQRAAADDGNNSAQLGVGSEGAAIELSLKISECYARLGNAAAAHKGLSWCIEAAKTNFEREEEPCDDTVAMLGMSLDAMGLFFSEQSRHSDAISLYKHSLQICAFLSDAHRGTKMVMAHNKLASAHAAAGNTQQALHHVRCTV